LALEVVTGAATAPGATLTNWTLATGNSLTVRNTPFDAKIQLLEMWGFNQAAGRMVIRSPKLHDNVQGLRAFITATDPKPLLPFRDNQRLVPQDSLVAQQSGSAVGGQTEIGAFLVYYENLPGADARFLDEDGFISRFLNYSLVETVHTPTVAATYSGEVAINSSFDNFKANTDYALCGYLVSANCAVVGWRGVDTGNLRVAGPGDVLGRQYTNEWFIRLSRIYRMPLIPVFNAANRFAFLVDIVQNQALTAVTVTSILAELSPAKPGFGG
jgi:hypothetical protein